MDIVPISAADVEAVAPLAADFRVTLRALKGRHTGPDEGAARKELSSYRVCRIAVYPARPSPAGRRIHLAAKSGRTLQRAKGFHPVFLGAPQQRKNVSLSCAPRLHGAESG